MFLTMKTFKAIILRALDSMLAWAHSELRFGGFKKRKKYTRIPYNTL